MVRPAACSEKMPRLPLRSPWSNNSIAISLASPAERNRSKASSTKPCLMNFAASPLIFS
jgi:hypothetical protein